MSDTYEKAVWPVGYAHGGLHQSRWIILVSQILAGEILRTAAPTKRDAEIARSQAAQAFRYRRILVNMTVRHEGEEWALYIRLRPEAQS